MVRERRLGHDPDHAVLSDRTTGPATGLMLGEPGACRPVHGVLGVKQGDDHVDVEKGAHQTPN